MIRRRLRLRQLRRQRLAETRCGRGIHEVLDFPAVGNATRCIVCGALIVIGGD